MKNFILISALCLLSACGGPVKPVQVEPTAKTVGVISAIPQELHLDTLALKLFIGGNTGENITLPEWPVNVIAENAMRQALQSRYSVVPVPMPPGFGASGGLLSNVPDIGGQIHELVHGPSADLYVVLWMNWAAVPQGTGLRRLGLGLYQNNNPLGDGKAHIYAHLAMSVVDGRSFKVLTTSHLEDVPGHGEAVWDLLNYEWKDHWSQMTDSDRVMILQTADSLLQKSIVTTLKEMNLSAQ